MRIVHVNVHPHVNTGISPLEEPAIDISLCSTCTCISVEYILSILFLRARQAKDPTTGSAETVTPSTVQPPPPAVTQTSSTASSAPGPTDVCRVQVRLPNGRVIRHNFPCSASLNDVATLVMEKEPHFSTVIFVQVKCNLSI
jgi:hypothetical protein